MPESQSGFRKGKSTMDNIFVLNRIVQKEMVEKIQEEKVYVFFADLKAAFDKIDRQIMWNTLKEMKDRWEDHKKIGEHLWRNRKLR